MSNSTCPYRATSSANASEQSGPQLRRYTPSQIEEIKDDMEALAPALAWVDDFVAQSNPDLGRTGRVCPYVPEALHRDMLECFVVSAELTGQGRDRNDEEDYIAVLEPAILGLRDHFLATQTKEAKLRLFHSFMMVFRGIRLAKDRAALLIEKIQWRLKPRFVELGLMLGEFHPLSEANGLRNSNFRPLRSPVPLLVIRNMVDIDFAFLSRQRDPAPLRVHFLTHYLKFIGPSLSASERRNAECALEEAERQTLQIA